MEREETFGVALRARLEELGMTQAELARQIERRAGHPVARSRVNNWLKGGWGCEPSDLPHLSRALGYRAGSRDDRRLRDLSTQARRKFRDREHEAPAA